MEHNTCRENLSAYLDGELTQKERLELETHLAGCADCRAELGQLKAVSGLVKAHAMEPVPPALKRAVLEKKRASFGWLKPALALSAAAAVVAVIVNVTGVRDNAMLTSSGFGARENAVSGLYDLNLQSGAPAEKSAAAAGLPSGKPQPASSPAPVWTAEAAGGAGALNAVPEAAPARSEAESRGAAVRGSLARAKASSALSASSLKAEAAAGKADRAEPYGYPAESAAADKYFAPATAPAAPREFRGPVCVQVREPASLNEADAGMEEAKVFLKGTGTRVTEAAPGDLRFVKDDGSAVTVTRADCDYCFIFFDGTKDPLAVKDLSVLPARYRAYFGK